MLWFHNCRQITENCPTTPRKNCPGKTQKYPHENQRSPSRHQHARCACPASPCQGTPEHQHFISELTKRAHALKAHQTIMSDNRLARSDLRDPRHNQAKAKQPQFGDTTKSAVVGTSLRTTTTTEVQQKRSSSGNYSGINVISLLHNLFSHQIVIWFGSVRPLWYHLYRNYVD